ncbi:SRPBCC domain-containing protein [Uliginosibacterium sp. H3]|uniref:SRPBCC domain-containing protein n=1 Tax=Uliginosibacterium silvisoli TaxID=3114758 RepID=A0ABU6K4N4_9RHOO|nr:SRPBCC domain-containing protein [Uliginosibacterium sp. H3]
MNDQDFTRSFSVDQTPAQVFAAINNVRGWWSQEIEGDTDKAGAVFAYHYKDVHRCTLKIVEFVPSEKIVWHVLSNYFSFTQDTTEWTGTKIRFDIARVGGKTEVRFTHDGLVPEDECYEACSEGWSTYVNSLRSLVSTGQGSPNIGQPLTETERALS